MMARPPIVMLPPEANVMLAEIEHRITDLRAAIDESWGYL